MILKIFTIFAVFACEVTKTNLFLYFVFSLILFQKIIAAVWEQLQWRAGSFYLASANVRRNFKFFMKLGLFSFREDEQCC